MVRGLKAYAACLLALGLFAQGCSTLTFVNFDGGKVQEAPETHDEGLYQMRLALSHHLKGEWNESNLDLKRAEAYFSKLPRHRVGRSILAWTWSDRKAGYRGPAYERVFLHTLGMLNFAFMGQLDAALVEARQMDALLRAIRLEAPDYPEDPFARYLAAKLYEATGRRDDAYIDLVKAYEGLKVMSKEVEVEMPRFIAGDLLRLAKLGGHEDDVRKWQKEFPGAELAPLPDAEHTEIWVMVWHGWLPERVATGFAGQVKEGASTPSPKWQVGVARAGAEKALLEPLYDVEGMMQNAASDKNSLAGQRQVGRTMFRMALLGAAVVATGGLLAQPEMVRLALAGSGDGDTRIWGNLPSSIWAARLRVPAQAQQLSIEIKTDKGFLIQKQAIQPKAGRIALLRFVTGREKVLPRASPSATQGPGPKLAHP